MNSHNLEIPTNEIVTFTNGRAALTVEQLEQSARYQMANGNLPNSRPVEHFQLITDLLEGAERQNLAPRLDPIIATERQTLRVNYEGEKELCPLENLLFQRLVARVHLGEDVNGKNSAVAIAFNGKGIELAFGTNVQICANQQIFGERVMRTYGREKLSFTEMMNIYGEWMRDFHGYRDEQFEIIENLETIEVDHEEIESVTGDLFSRAVLNNSGYNVEAPLNQVQVADFVKSQKLKLYDRGSSRTAWDLVQFGTHELKPQKSDLVTMFQHNNSFCNYVRDRYLKN